MNDEGCLGEQRTSKDGVWVQRHPAVMSEDSHHPDYRKGLNRALTLARTWGIDPEEMQGLYNDAYIKACRKFTLDRGATFYTFLMRQCFRTEVNGYFRKNRKKPLLEPLQDTIEYVPSPDNTAVQIDLVNLFCRLRELLPQFNFNSTHLDMALMKHWEGASWKEVGTAFGTSGESARVMASTLLKELREHINSDTPLGKALKELYQLLSGGSTMNEIMVGGSEDEITE